MSEIINLQVGRCGNNVGNSFWENILNEHQIDNCGTQLENSSNHPKERQNVFFQEHANQKFMPRAVLIDFEPGIIDSIKGSLLGRIFDQNCFVIGQTSAGDNWAKGYHSEGPQWIEYALDAIRKQIEACDCLQGFQIMNSLGGGTGSGFGSLLMSRIREEFSDCMLHTYSVFPSSQVSDVVVEPYNATLSLRHLIENVHQVLTFDNEALYRICTKTSSDSTYQKINHIVANAIANITCTLRFPGALNSSMRKMSLNLVSFPRLHFTMSSLSPISLRPTTRDLRVPELYQQLFDAKNFLTDADPRHGRVLSAVTIYRGKVSEKEVLEQSLNVGNKNSSYFVEWIPNNLKTSLYQVPSKDFNTSAVSIFNSTAIQEMFRRLGEKFGCLFKRRAFLHWYTENGLDEQELIEAEASLKDLISEYQFYQDATAEDDEQNF